MSLASDVYDKTLEKLNLAMVHVKQILLSGDLSKADAILKEFRVYKLCHYCISYRQTLDERGFKGACDTCPLHHYGQDIEGRELNYNGCYRIGDYRKMVAAASWFRSDPSKIALIDFLEKLAIVIVHFQAIKDRLCHSV